MTRNGARGATATEMDTALRFPRWRSSIAD